MRSRRSIVHHDHPAPVERFLSPARLLFRVATLLSGTTPCPRKSVARWILHGSSPLSSDTTRRDNAGLAKLEAVPSVLVAVGNTSRQLWKGAPHRGKGLIGAGRHERLADRGLSGISCVGWA
jgi:hypothetical protein